jgi:hypothetical protein
MLPTAIGARNPGRLGQIRLLRPSPGTVPGASDVAGLAEEVHSALQNRRSVPLSVVCICNISETSLSVQRTITDRETHCLVMRFPR